MSSEDPLAVSPLHPPDARAQPVRADVPAAALEATVDKVLEALGVARTLLVQARGDAAGTDPLAHGAAAAERGVLVLAAEAVGVAVADLNEEKENNSIGGGGIFDIF